MYHSKHPSQLSRIVPSTNTRPMNSRFIKARYEPKIQESWVEDFCFDDERAILVSIFVCSESGLLARIYIRIGNIPPREVTAHGGANLLEIAKDI